MQTNGSDPALNVQEPAAPQYQPNFKFSVMKKEHEIPEMYRGLIKDAETEKQVREIFEKAYGIEHVTSARDKLKDEYGKYRSQVDPVMKIAQTLQHHYDRGDLSAYFRTLGLQKEQIWKWALEQAEIQELPEHQRRVYDQQQEAQMRAYELEQRLQAQEAEKEQILVQQRQAELDQTLSNPDVSSFIKSFDQRNGEGAFKNEVIARGQLYWHTQGVDVPPQQLVQEIMTRFGMNQPAPAVQAQPQAQTPQSPAPKSPQDLPVIPNTGSGTASPAQRSIRSLDDLKKVYTEKYGS